MSRKAHSEILSGIRSCVFQIMRIDEYHFGKMLALPVFLVYYFARHDP